MSGAAAAAPRHPLPGPGLRATGLLVLWLVLVLLLALLQWQQHRLDRASTLRQRLVLALSDLDAGALHDGLGQGGDTPWNRAQGRALLRQGLREIDALQGNLDLPLDLQQRVQSAMPRLQALLEGDPAAADPPGARLALHAALSAGHELGRHVAQERDRLQRSQSQVLRAVVGLEGLVLVGIAWGLLRARRHRRAADVELQAREQHFRQLTESLPLVVWTCGSDGACDYVSPRWQDWTGRERSAALGSGWLDAVHADDRAQVESAWQRARDLAIDFQAEFRLLLRGGDARWVASRATRLRDREGRTVRWLGSHTDLTDLRRARAEAHDATALVAATLESTGNGLLVIDDAGRIVTWNRRLVQLSGLPEALLRDGDPDPVLACIAGQALQPQAVLDAMQGRAGDRAGQALFDWADGRCIELQSAALQAGTDSMGRVLSFADVTARQRQLLGAAQRAAELDREVRARTAALEQAMAERAESESFIRTVTDSVPLQLSYWTREGRCGFANRACREALGLDATQLIGQPMDQVLDAALLARARPLMNAALQGRMQSVERMAAGAAGAERHLWILYVPHRRDDEVMGFFAVVTDVTPLKRTQQQLQQLNQQLMGARDAAQAANRAKSDFLATLSHEIRTPMNVVLGLARQLRSDDGSAGRHERIDRLQDAARHLLTIVNDVLDLSKIEAGHVRLEPADLAPSALLDQVRSLVIEDARARGLQVRTESEGLPPRLRGDATRLRQALLNLAANAVKFTERGEVVLRARVLLRDGPRLLLRFEVQDTGVGVDPDQIERLFTAYEQADASTARRHGGTGLGLSITRRLAALMGGRAGADSRPGRGSTFWFTAWLDAAGAHAPPERAMPGRMTAEQLRLQHAGAQVLLAEDHPINQDIARQLLQAAGLHVDVVDDGQAALQRLQDQPYDLLLMDMQMPRLDGLAAARQIRALPQGSRLPIVALTANAFAEDRAACLAAGMDDFIAKPVEPGTLYAMLSHWLGRPRRGDGDGADAEAAEPATPGSMQRGKRGRIDSAAGSGRVVP